MAALGPNDFVPNARPGPATAGRPAYVRTGCLGLGSTAGDPVVGCRPGRMVTATGDGGDALDAGGYRPSRTPGG
jgi:hypothetical protein